MPNRSSKLSRPLVSLGTLVRLSLILLMLLWTMTGCTVAVTPIKPPIYLASSERPALVDEYGSFSKPGQKWLQDLVNAYLRNCITLKILRSEDPMSCDAGLR